MLNEVVRTTGDVRRLLAQSMMDIKTGNLSVDKGLAIASLSKEITASMQAEVNTAKVQVAMLSVGKSIGQLTHMGKMIIEDTSVPTLSGISQE